MDNLFAFSLTEIPLVALVLIVAFSVHEFAHAFVAYKFGDPTAKKQGRLTLSPLAHLDLFGTLLIFIAGFGWARPVPVNRSNFKNPRLAGILVSVAGPISNLILGAIGILVWYSLLKIGIDTIVPTSVYDTLHTFFNLFVRLNVLLFVFNLLPFPPLDGYRIIEDLLPANVRYKLTPYESYGALIFLIIIFIPPLYQNIIAPIFNIAIPTVIYQLETLFAPIFMFITFITL